MKNKGMQKLHASSRNSEAIDMWKVACDPPSRLAWYDPPQNLGGPIFFYYS